MGKRQTKETYGQVKNDQGTAQGQYGNDRTIADAERGQAGDNIGSSREAVESGYRGLMGGNTQNVGNVNSRIDTGKLNDVYSRYMGLADKGGYSDESRANIMGDIGGLRAMGKNGGIDDASMARFRGNGVYDEFSKTGGLSDSDRGNIRSRALSSVSANASGTNDELARRRAVQGGFAPGFDSASRALQRDTARNASSTALDANLGIMDRVNQGRQWGAEGATNSENALQGLRTGNMYKGLMGASTQEMGMNNSIFGNQMGALGGARGTAGDIAGWDSENINNEFRNRGIDEGNINRSQDAKYRGLAGMSDLYAGDMGRYDKSLDRSLGVTDRSNNTNLGYYGARNPLAMQNGVGGNIMKAVGAGAGAAAGMFNPIAKFKTPGGGKSMGTGPNFGQYES